MKVFLVLAMVVLVPALSVSATTPEQAVPMELLAGALGSAAGWAGGFFAGRALAMALGAESQPDTKDLLTLSSVAIAVTGVTSLAVIAAGSWQGIDGNAFACVGGALIGMAIGMLVEPLLGTLLVPQGGGVSQGFGPVIIVIEVFGFASMVLVPAVGATVGFNMGARAH